MRHDSLSRSQPHSQLAGLLALGALALAALAPSVAARPGAQVDWRVDRRLVESEAPVKVWVFFADKGPSDKVSQRLANLEREFPARASARRVLRRQLPGLVDARDLEVHRPYVEAIENTGAKVHRQSRWLNAISATASAEQVATIAASSIVSEIRLVNRGRQSAVALGGCFGTGGGFYGFAKSQLEISRIPELHQLGFTGEGVVIGVLDSGFATTHTAFNHPTKPLDVIASYDFVDDDPVVGIQPGDDPADHNHGTLILGTLAAYEPETMVGAAYDASYVLCKTEDPTSETQVEEDNYVAGLEFAELNGADVVTSSLSYIDWYTQADLDGVTAVTTQAVNVATANGVFCVTAAGNSEHDSNPTTSSLGAPGDAFDVITVGATEVTEEIAYFSSDGPSADGRVKPEVLAMGDQVATVWPDDNFSYSCASGTSLSTPIVAGAIACLVQAHPVWDVPTMRSNLFSTASYLGKVTPDPEFVYGYGIVDALGAAGDPFAFEMGPVQPGSANQFNSVEVAGAVPGDLVFFGWALGTGLLPIPACPGLAAGIDPIVVLTAATANAEGMASSSTFVPFSAVGFTVYVQAIDFAACTGTQVVSVTF